MAIGREFCPGSIDGAVGVRAQSVNGIPMSLAGTIGGVGFGGAGLSEGGVFDGLAVI